MFYLILVGFLSVFLDGFQVIVGKGDYVWGKEYVEVLGNIFLMFIGFCFGDVVIVEIEGYGLLKLIVELVVKYLQFVNKFFVQVEFFYFCVGMFCIFF